MQLFIFLIAYPFLWIISKLPYRLFYILSDCIYFILYRILKYRKKVVRRNLTLSFPEKKLSEIIEIEQKFYHHFCDIFMEMIKTMSISNKEIQKRMTFNNIDVLAPILKKKCSFILICGHYNNYEWMLSLSLQLNYPAYAAYTPISNKYFDRMIKKIRMKYNAFLISRYNFTNLVNSNENNGKMAVYGLASDQSPSNSSKNYWRTFMGIKVPVFTGAERLGKQFNLPIVFCDIRKKKRGYYETFFEILALEPNEKPNYEITDLFIERVEAQIRQKPEYYFWTHNRFKHAKI